MSTSFLDIVGFTVSKGSIRGAALDNADDVRRDARPSMLLLQPAADCAIQSGAERQPHDLPLRSVPRVMETGDSTWHQERKDGDETVNHPVKLALTLLSTTLAFALPALAGVPLNNLEGVGGVAYNPLAYTAGQNASTNAESYFSNPQVGVWGVRLYDKNINWSSVGIAETIGGRLELSYGYETIRLGGPDPKEISKHNLGAKFLAIRENQFGDYTPAVSAGTIWKSTDGALVGPNHAGFDYYVVATKLIPQAPLPVLVSGGLLYTDEEVTGVLGHNRDHDLTWFANLDVVPLPYLATGLEYKQGARYGNGFKNADYWDAHVAWFVDPNVTLVAAYTFTGSEKSASRVGLGGGLVVSAQYAF